MTVYGHMGPNLGRISGPKVHACQVVVLEMASGDKDPGMLTCVFFVLVVFQQHFGRGIVEVWREVYWGHCVLLDL